MIATLPMYDRPETAAANDRLYSLFRRHFSAAPKTLARDGPHWLDRDLLLSQTCSLPYRAVLHSDVNIVATPIHPISCPAGHYFSVIVVRDDDARGAFKDYRSARLAINSRMSQSGWAVMDKMAQENVFVFKDVTETGSHQASARAVAEGKADIAAIDAVTWTMIRRWDAFSSSLRVLTDTPPSPISAKPPVTTYSVVPSGPVAVRTPGRRVVIVGA